MLNIDKFLDGEIKNKVESKVNTLDFQADTEINLEKIKKEISNSSPDKLGQIYKEVLKFDKDLSEKFISISEETTKSLNLIVHEFYEKTYLENKKTYSELNTEFKNVVVELDKALIDQDFVQIVALYNKSRNIFNDYPSGFLIEKVNDLQIVEKYYEKVMQFVQAHTKGIENKFQKEFKKYFTAIEHAIKIKDFEKLELLIKITEKSISEIPLYMASYFLKLEERTNLILKLARNKLYEFKRNHYARIEKDINDKISNFYSLLMTHKVKDATILYNNILKLFSDSSEFFLERKKELFHKIVECNTALNNSLLSYNINFLSSSYNIGQLIAYWEEYYDLVRSAPINFSKEKVKNAIIFLDKVKNNSNAEELKKKYIHLVLLYKESVKKHTLEQITQKKNINKNQIKAGSIKLATPNKIIKSDSKNVSKKERTVNNATNKIINKNNKAKQKTTDSTIEIKYRDENIGYLKILHKEFDAFQNSKTNADKKINYDRIIKTINKSNLNIEVKKQILYKMKQLVHNTNIK